MLSHFVHCSISHSQALVKSETVQGILQVLLNIMASSQGEDNEDDEMLGEEELGTQSPASYAAQVILTQ